jgi:hypothetical protein
MSALIAQQLAELEQEELELETSGLDPEELKEAREEIRLQREELEMEREQQEAQEELEEEIRLQQWRQEQEQEQEQEQTGEPTRSVLTPLELSLQRVYGTAFPGLSNAELHEHLRFDQLQETTAGEEHRIERQLERYGRIEVRGFFLQDGHYTNVKLKTPRRLTPPVQRPRNLTSVPPLPPPAECTPSVSPTRSDAPRKERTHVNDDDKVVLMTLCTQYQAEHVRNKKMGFWLMISELLEQNTGLKLRDPSKTVAGIVAKRKATVRKEKSTSGMHTIISQAKSGTNI